MQTLYSRLAKSNDMKTNHLFLLSVSALCEFAQAEPVTVTIERIGESEFAEEALFLQFFDEDGCLITFYSCRITQAKISKGLHEGTGCEILTTSTKCSPNPYCPSLSTTPEGRPILWDVYPPQQ
ncbi:MAG: hypothetical protein KDM91_21985 [Verrucomicrobiae bacterium]|nr:hypothetical protein [Verrucomicrobiae bacterium]